MSRQRIKLPGETSIRVTEDIHARATLEEGVGKVKTRSDRVQIELATTLLMSPVISGTELEQPEMKTPRQLSVRFGHAPRVKLTLTVRIVHIPEAPSSRVLRIASDSATVQTRPS